MPHFAVRHRTYALQRNADEDVADNTLMKVGTRSVEWAESASRSPRPPYISQRTPFGAPPGFNGEVNCGPTTMAMIARRAGRFGRLTDGALIQTLARIGGTNDDVGTTTPGMQTIARHLGFECDVTRGIDLLQVRRELADGNAVVLTGDYYAMPPHADATKYEGHYVLVWGTDARGRFLVHDPYDYAVEAVSARELSHFVDAHREGGYSLFVRQRQISQLRAIEPMRDWSDRIGSVTSVKRRIP